MSTGPIGSPTTNPRVQSQAPADTTPVQQSQVQQAEKAGRMSPTPVTDGVDATPGQAQVGDDGAPLGTGSGVSPEVVAKLQAALDKAGVKGATVAELGDVNFDVTSGKLGMSFDDLVALHGALSKVMSGGDEASIEQALTVLGGLEQSAKDAQKIPAGLASSSSAMMGTDISQIGKDLSNAVNQAAQAAKKAAQAAAKGASKSASKAGAGVTLHKADPGQLHLVAHFDPNAVHLPAAGGKGKPVLDLSWMKNMQIVHSGATATPIKVNVPQSVPDSIQTMLDKGEIDINSFVQMVLRDSYLETTAELKDYALKVQFYNECKKKIRAELKRARDADVPLAGKPDDTPLSPSFIPQQINTDEALAYTNQDGSTTTSGTTPASTPASSSAGQTAQEPVVNGSSLVKLGKIEKAVDGTKLTGNEIAADLEAGEAVTLQTQAGTVTMTGTVNKKGLLEVHAQLNGKAIDATVDFGPHNGKGNPDISKITLSPGGQTIAIGPDSVPTVQVPIAYTADGQPIMSYDQMQKDILSGQEVEVHVKGEVLKIKAEGDHFEVFHNGTEVGRAYPCGEPYLDETTFPPKFYSDHDPRIPTGYMQIDIDNRVDNDLSTKLDSYHDGSDQRLYLGGDPPQAVNGSYKLGENDADILQGQPNILDGAPLASTSSGETAQGGTSGTGTTNGSSTTSGTGQPGQPITNKAGLDTYIKDMEDKLNSVGDDAQLATVDAQNILQKQQQTLQMMSNISKMLNDTAMAVIRKIGG